MAGDSSAPALPQRKPRASAYAYDKMSIPKTDTSPVLAPGETQSPAFSVVDKHSTVPDEVGPGAPAAAAAAAASELAQFLPLVTLMRGVALLCEECNCPIDDALTLAGPHHVDCRRCDSFYVAAASAIEGSHGPPSQRCAECHVMTVPDGSAGAAQHAPTCTHYTLYDIDVPVLDTRRPWDLGPAGIAARFYHWVRACICHQ